MRRASGLATPPGSINASNSVGSDLSNLFTGKPTDKAVWFIIGGAAALVIGLFGTLVTGRSKT